MPAYINDCINCFWNNMKPKSNGDTDNNVAAEIIDQLTPDSGAPNIASPTVSGRVFTEFVITRGHKKLFQWQLTDTKPQAKYVGLAKGTQTRNKTPNILQPSTRAASSNSLGMVLNVCLKRKIPNALAI